MGSWLGSYFYATPDVSGKAHPSIIDRLSQDQLDEFHIAFSAFDKDGGGSIDSAELRNLLRSVGQDPTEVELRRMIDSVDADGTGDLSFAEFVTLMAHNMPDPSTIELALHEAFEVFDDTGDGNIDVEEIQRIMMNVGEPVTLDAIEKVWEVVDADTNGRVSYEEFAAAMVSGIGVNARSAGMAK